MFTSTIKYLGGLHTECTHTRSGTMIGTDAPVDNQGKGEAFSPTDLMSTSLVTCMLTTMAIHAGKNNIPFDEANADMIKTMASNPRRVSRIEITVRMPRFPYTPDQKKFLEDIGLNCPVALSLNPNLETKIEFVYP